MSRSLIITLAALTAAVAATFISPQAEAVQRTHVSAAFGSDSNTATNCSATAPCRFFQAAMTVTDNNGEVIVLDSGGYGAVTLTQSISLIAPTGVYAGISVFQGVDGVTIATAGVNAVLRGITINGQGGNYGINMTAGNKLTIENCVIANLEGAGIVVNTAATVRVTGTTIRDNYFGISLQDGARGIVTRATISGNQHTGIRVLGTASSTTTTADIADSTVDGSSYGVWAQSLNTTAVVKVAVRDSWIVRNVGVGLYADSAGPIVVTLSASNNLISNNYYGIFGDRGVKVWASGNTVSDNYSGFYNNGIATIFESAGNNAVRNNTADTTGTITVIATR